MAQKVSTNGQTGVRVIMLGEKEFRLRLGYNEVSEVERVLEAPMSQVMIRTLTSGARFSDVRAFFWSAAQGQHGVYVLKDAGNVLEEHIEDFQAISDALFESLAECFPPASFVDEPVDDEPEAAPAEAAVGKS